MTIISAYKSDDGNLYETEEDCKKADEKFKNTTVIDKLGVLIESVLPDCKWHATGVIYDDKEFFIRKKRNGRKAFEIALKIREIKNRRPPTGDYITLINTIYDKTQEGFSDPIFSDKLNELFWNNIETWYEAIRDIIKTQIHDIDSKIVSLQKRKDNLNRNKELIETFMKKRKRHAV